MKTTTYSIFALCLQLGIILPALIFIGNQEEFSQGLLTILPYTFGFAAALASVVFLALILVHRVSPAVAATLGVSLVLGVYAQSSVFLWDYGVFDGTAIKWNNYGARGWIDLILWLAIFTVATIKAPVVIRRGAVIIGVALLLQMSSLIPSLFTRPIQWHAIAIPGRSELFKLSSERNVLVLVLDAFQAPAFESLLKESPQWGETFKDFTFYRNTVAAFPTTLLSFPSFLTGVPYESSVKPWDYFSNTFRTRALPQTLAESGFKVSMATSGKFCEYLDRSYCGDRREFTSAVAGSDLLDQAAELIDYTLFRASPHHLKREIFDRERWFVQHILKRARRDDASREPSLAFINAFNSNAAVSETSPVFRFLHILIPHFPIRFDSNCSLLQKPGPYTTQAFNGHAGCALKLTSEVLATLKRLAIYDRSTIVVMADHGSQIDYGQYNRSYAESNDLFRIQFALPLMLVKRAGAHQESLQISRAPVSLTDLPASITDDLKLKLYYPGTPFWNVGEDSSRVRTFNRLSVGFRHWKVVDGGAALKDSSPYEITGDAWKVESWRKSR